MPLKDGSDSNHISISSKPIDCMGSSTPAVLLVCAPCVGGVPAWPYESAPGSAPAETA